MSDFFNKTLENMRQGPLGPLVAWAEVHPRLAMWIVLGVPMVAIVLSEALKIQGMQWNQLLFISVATALTAGACVWIISWEDDDDVEGEAAPKAEAKAEAKTAAAEEKSSKAKSTPSKRPAAKKGTGRLSSKKK